MLAGLKRLIGLSEKPKDLVLAPTERNDRVIAEVRARMQAEIHWLRLQRAYGMLGQDDVARLNKLVLRLTGLTGYSATTPERVVAAARLADCEYLVPDFVEAVELRNYQMGVGPRLMVPGDYR